MKKIFLPTFIVFWLFTLGYLGIYFHAGHKVEMSAEKAKDIPIQFKKTWGMVHILGEGCGCSEIVAEHLIKRGPLNDAAETIFLIGKMNEFEAKLKNVGYKISSVKNIEKYI